MLVTIRSVTSVAIASPRDGLPPVEEFLSIESWIRAMPEATTLRIGLSDGTSYLTSAGALRSSERFGEVLDRIRMQRRLADL